LVGYKGVASQIFPSSLYPECVQIISIVFPHILVIHDVGRL
jgi:hypothetical protein